MAVEDKLAERRAQILTESLEISNEPRWGYFGVPGSLAIGDNSYAPKATRKIPDEGESGDPIRNIQAAPLKKGAGPDVFFQFEPPLALGDPYQDPGAAMKKGRVVMLDPDASFKPPGKVKYGTNKLGYMYVPHKDNVKDPKETMERYKDVMPPRQIYTNPAKKGGGGVITQGVLFGTETADKEYKCFPEHMPDDYDGAKKMRAKELEEHKSKVQEMPFKAMDYGNKHFFANQEVFHYDVPSHVPRDPIPDKTTPYPHEMNFFPANPMKKGLVHSLIGGIPEYIADPVPGGAVRKPKDEDAPPAFRLGNARAVCNPMPSVVTNTRNMRNERPSSFMRPSL